MNIFIDANLSPALAAALAELSKPDGHVVKHKFELFRRDTSDVDWINALSRSEHWVIITQDRFKKNALERQALRDAGFTVFVLKNSWKDHTFWSKAHQLVRWWPAILQQSELVTGGALFVVPYKFTGKGKFEQEKL